MFGKKEDHSAASVELQPIGEEVIEEEITEEVLEEATEEAVQEEELSEELEQVIPDFAKEDNVEMIYDPDSQVQFSQVEKEDPNVEKDKLIETDNFTEEVSLWSVLKALADHKADDFLFNYVPDYNVNNDVIGTLFNSFDSDEQLLNTFHLYLEIKYGLTKGDIVKCVHTIGGTDSEPEKKIETVGVVLNRPDPQVNNDLNTIEIYDILAKESFTLDENLKVVEVTGLKVAEGFEQAL